MTRRTLLALAIAIGVVVPVAAFLAPYELKPNSWLTARDIDHRIQQVGPNRVVDELYGSGAWEVVVARISEGRSDWLQLVPRLSTGVDADSAEDLRDHLGLALAKNATGVLAVLDPRNGPMTGVDTVCSVPFGNNLTQPPRADLASQSILAVETVKAPKLQLLRDRCLEVLRSGVCRMCA